MPPLDSAHTLLWLPCTATVKPRENLQRCKVIDSSSIKMLNNGLKLSAHVKNCICTYTKHSIQGIF